MHNFNTPQTPRREFEYFILNRGRSPHEVVGGLKFGLICFNLEITDKEVRDKCWKYFMRMIEDELLIVDGINPSDVYFEIFELDTSTAEIFRYLH